MLNDGEKRKAESGNVRPLDTPHSAQLVPRRLHRPLIVAPIHARLVEGLGLRSEIDIIIEIEIEIELELGLGQFEMVIISTQSRANLNKIPL